MAVVLLLASSGRRQRTSQNLVFKPRRSHARIDPYSVVIGSARRSEFQSKLACPLEGLRRITRRERHGGGYDRNASPSPAGAHHPTHRGPVRRFDYDQPIVLSQTQLPTAQPTI